MSKRTFHWLLFLTCAISLGVAVGLLVGCGDARLSLFGGDKPAEPSKETSHAYNPTPPASAPTPNLLDGLSSTELKKQAADLQKEIAANKKTISDLVIANNQKTVDLQDVQRQITVAEDNERVQAWKTFLLWLGGICIVGAGVAFALSFAPVIKYLPSVPRSVAAVLGIIGAGAIVLAFMVAYVILLVKWILIIASGLAIIAGFFVVRWVVLKLHAFYQVAATGQAAMDTLAVVAPEAHAAIKDEARQIQQDLGVHGFVDKILAVARDVIHVKPTSKEITTRIELPEDHAPTLAPTPQEAVTQKLAVLDAPRPPIA